MNWSIWVFWANLVWLEIFLIWSFHTCLANKSCRGWKFDWLQKSTFEYLTKFTDNFFQQEIVKISLSNFQHIVYRLFCLCYHLSSSSVALPWIGFYAGIIYFLEFACYSWSSCKSWLIKEIIHWVWPVTRWVGMFTLSLILRIMQVAASFQLS